MIQLFVDIINKQFVESAKTLRLRPEIGSLTQGDKDAVRVNLLTPTGDSSKPYRYVDYTSGKTVKLALVRGKKILAFTNTWTPSPSPEVVITELSDTQFRASFNVEAVGGSWELIFETADPTVKSTGAMPYDITADALAQILTGMNLNAGAVQVVKNDLGWNISFAGGHDGFDISGEAAGLESEVYIEGVFSLNTEEIDDVLEDTSSVDDCRLELELSENDLSKIQTVHLDGVTVRKEGIPGGPAVPTPADEFYTKAQVDEKLDDKLDKSAVDDDETCENPSATTVWSSRAIFHWINTAFWTAVNNLVNTKAALYHTHPVTDIPELGTAATKDVDTDGTLDADSDDNVPSQKAVKSYVDAHASDTENPHAVTKDQVGLGSVPNVDCTNASNLTSGTVPIERLPAAAMFDLIFVEDEDARFELTEDEVQLGDVVKQEDTGIFYFIKDADELDNAAGYEELTVGAAASVPWGGVTGKPAIVTDLAAIVGAAADDVIQFVGGAWTKRTSAQLKTSLALAIADVAGLQTALDAKAESRNAIVTEATTARTLSLTDENKYIRFTNGSATTLTVPRNSTAAIPVGAQIDLFQAGTGQVTIAAEDGTVTINSKNGDLKIAGQFSGAVLKKVGANEWDLVGDLAS